MLSEVVAYFGPKISAALFLSPGIYVLWKISFCENGIPIMDCYTRRSTPRIEYIYREIQKLMESVQKCAFRRRNYYIYTIYLYIYITIRKKIESITADWGVSTIIRCVVSAVSRYFVIFKSGSDYRGRVTKMYEAGGNSASSAGRSQSLISHCYECEIDLTADHRLCPQCGGRTVKKAQAVAAATSATEAGNGIFGRFASVEDYIRQIFEESLTAMAPSKQISADYLKNLGRIIVDERRSILHDTTLDVGPLRILAVPASFSSVTSSSLCLCGELMFGDPRFGDAALQEPAAGKIVILERGKVTFAQKALAAQAAGAIALVITQNAAIWPFLMTDSAGELSSTMSLDIPVVMISQADAAIVGNLISVKRTDAILRVTLKDTICSICQDEVEEGQEVLKLHCRHVYHTTCVVSWLQSHNTCPLCRLQMPNDEEAKGANNGPNDGGFNLFG